MGYGHNCLNSCDSVSSSCGRVLVVLRALFRDSIFERRLFSLNYGAGWRDYRSIIGCLLAATHLQGCQILLIADKAAPSAYKFVTSGFGEFNVALVCRYDLARLGGL